MDISLTTAAKLNFLGNSPQWYKIAIIAFLIINPIIFAIDPFIAGWLFSL
jgi:NhaB family Na+:H+ antiporter